MPKLPPLWHRTSSCRNPVTGPILRSCEVQGCTNMNALSRAQSRLSLPEVMTLTSRYVSFCSPTRLYSIQAPGGRHCQIPYVRGRSDHSGAHAAYETRPRSLPQLPLKLQEPKPWATHASMFLPTDTSLWAWKTLPKPSSRTASQNDGPSSKFPEPSSRYLQGHSAMTRVPRLLQKNSSETETAPIPNLRTVN